MTDSLGSSDIASLEIREKEFGSGNLKNIVENESESSLKKIKSPLFEVQNCQMKGRNRRNLALDQNQTEKTWFLAISKL